MSDYGDPNCCLCEGPGRRRGNDLVCEAHRIERTEGDAAAQEFVANRRRRAHAADEAVLARVRGVRSRGMPVVELRPDTRTHAEREADELLRRLHNGDPGAVEWVLKRIRDLEAAVLELAPREHVARRDPWEGIIECEGDSFCTCGKSRADELLRKLGLEGR